MSDFVGKSVNYYYTIHEAADSDIMLHKLSIQTPYRPISFFKGKTRRNANKNNAKQKIITLERISYYKIFKEHR